MLIGLRNKDEENIVNGLNSLYKISKSFSSRSIKKPKIMFEKFHNIIGKTVPMELSLEKYYLDAFIYKFELLDLSLEQLWSMSMKTRSGLIEALSNSLDKLDTSKDEQFLISFCLESFLFQSQSFLDILMIFILISLGIETSGYMTKEKFEKILDKNLGIQKSKLFQNYFQKHVFNEESKPTIQDNWGNFLKSLRDKIAHRDLIRPSFESKEMIVDTILHDWPTINKLTIERLCQEIQNKSFELIIFVCESIYEQKWPV